MIFDKIEKLGAFVISVVITLIGSTGAYFIVTDTIPNPSALKIFTDYQVGLLFGIILSFGVGLSYRLIKYWK